MATHSPETSISSKEKSHSNITELKSPSNELMGRYTQKNIPKEQVESAMLDIQVALTRLRANSQFRKRYENLDIYGLLPLMIKESFLDNSRISKTGAVGYFQLKGDAIKDASDRLTDVTGIKKEYNPQNPVDNCILGIMYYVDTMERLQGIEKNISKEYVLFSYNAGVAKTKALIDLYNTEKGTRLIPKWSDFALWLAKKINPSAKQSSISSDEYGITYVSYFGTKDWSKDSTEISVSQKYTITKSKIQEGINYVEKIRAIAETDQSRSSSKPTSVPQAQQAPTTSVVISSNPKPVSNIPQLPRESASRVLPYDSSKDEFHGDGLVDMALHRLSSTIGDHSKYGHIRAEKGDTITKMLRNAGINPNTENVENFRNINRLDDGKGEDTIKIGAYYLIPLLSGTSRAPTIIPPASGEVIRPTPTPLLTPTKPTTQEKPTSQSSIEKERLSRDFYKWLDTIEVKNNSLKGKTFILDPGHGGADPGAVPIAMKDGKPIPYRMSDIAGGPGQEKVVANGKGDGHLRVVEARVVMDIAYRVAKQLKENGATVKITHYFQKGIDTARITENNGTYAPGLLDEIQQYDTWGDRSNSKFDEGSKDGLRKRVRIRNKMQEGLDLKNTYFISLHADRAPHDRKMSPNILYEPGNDGQKAFAHLLAENMGNIRNDQVTAGTRKEGIHVLRKSHGATNQNVLIELGNMADPNTAYALRVSKTRQEYAEGIYRGLHAVATGLGPIKVAKNQQYTQ